MPPQPVGPTLAGGQTAVPTIQAIPPAGMFAGTDAGSQPTQHAESGTGSTTAAPAAPAPTTAGGQAGGDGSASAAEGELAAAPAGQRHPAPGGLGQLINQFIGQLVAQHRSATASSGAPVLGAMPVIITFSFGSPGQMAGAAGLSDDKVPDPERAEELLSALSRPTLELIERLDHALRCEEAVRLSLPSQSAMLRLGRLTPLPFCFPGCRCRGDGADWCQLLGVHGNIAASAGRHGRPRGPCRIAPLRTCLP
jgi:hypothetical protein